MAQTDSILPQFDHPAGSSWFGAATQWVSDLATRAGGSLSDHEKALIESQTVAQVQAAGGSPAQVAQAKTDLQKYWSTVTSDPTLRIAAVVALVALVLLVFKLLKGK